MVLSSFSQSKAKWKGIIEYEDGIKVIKNPEQPLYGEIIFDLELDLCVGSTDDETATFYSSVIFSQLNNSLKLFHEFDQDWNIKGSCIDYEFIDKREFEEQSLISPQPNISISVQFRSEIVREWIEK